MENNRRINQKLYAILTKPEDFLGDPIFADDRGINPLTDKICSIKPKEKSKNEYELYITDLEKCGVLVKNVSCDQNLANFAQCGKFMIFLLLRFDVKSILGIIGSTMYAILKI